MQRILTVYLLLTFMVYGVFSATGQPTNQWGVKDVYVAGFESNGSKIVAKVWKNGVATSLTNGTKDAFAFSVYVSGTDVYVAGEESFNDRTSVAKVWKNGVATSLTNGTYVASAHSVYVSGADVYVAGEEDVNTTNPVAKVWKNGVATSLTDGSNTAFAFSVYVSGTDVYVAGHEKNGTKYVVKLWKNGETTSLTNGSNDAYASSVYVSGTDVYVAGYESNGTINVAKVWKNGVATSLTNGSNEASVGSVYVSGTDVYVAGAEKNGTLNVAKVWKNGVATSLTNGANDAGALAVYISGADVYVAGSESTGKKTVAKRSNDFAKVWENGVATSLTNGSNQAGAFSIFVTGSEKANTKPPTSKITFIQTNINCEEGKKVIERTLKSQDGVKSAAVDIKTGKLKLDYSSDGTPLTQIISLINEAGFDADRVKSTSTDKNPCKKTEPEERATNITIRTNITCEQGKEKVETRLKEQNGVLTAELDLNTSRVKVEYNEKIISLEKLIQVINRAGFDADKNKTSDPQNNPCKKPEIEEQATNITIQTNINCEEGKQKVESLLKEQNGIVSTTVYYRTGKLEIKNKKDGITTGEIIRLINNAGFDADKTKSKNAEKNPCAVKPPTGNILTIQTNINCEEGKSVIETRLKSMDGVRSAVVDIKTGKLTLNFRNDGKPLSQIINFINEVGFDADNIKSKNAENNPCANKEIVNNEKDKFKLKKIISRPNLLDATPGYRKAPIKFVPLQAQAGKGYSDTKIYNWVDPLGNKHTAAGKEILDEVNELEKSLNERGHSLREKKPLDGLAFPLKKVQKNDFTNCVITNELKKTSGPKYVITPSVNLKNYSAGKDVIESTVFSYFGDVNPTTEWKDGNLSTSLLFTRNGNDASVNMELVFQPDMYAKVSTCIADVSENEGGSTLFSTTVDVKKATRFFQPNKYNLSFEDGTEPHNVAKDYIMYVYHLVFSNAGNILPAATRYPKPYYVKLKFFDATGNYITTYQPNKLVLNNQLLMPIHVPSIGGNEYAGYNYEFLDPGIHCFGFYSKSTGFSADYYSLGSGYDGETKKTSVRANMDIGVKYYNWDRLLNSNAPATKDFTLFGYDIRSEEKYDKPDGTPEVRIPGSQNFKKEDPDRGIVTLLGKSYDLNTTNEDYFSDGIGEEIANVDFFIGPVPCNITVSVTGDVSMSTNYERSHKTDIKTTMTPHAKITMHGSGGMDAKILYAKVFADIDLLTIDMPYTLEVNNHDNNTNAKIDASLIVGGLAGQVYFQAGFCIPIPLVDDICKSFQIDILKWDGFKKTFAIDPKKGISLVK